MNNPVVIHHDWPMPKDYRREFILSIPDQEYQYRIMIDNEGIHSTDFHPDDCADFIGDPNAVLDFVEDSIMAVRMELGVP